jgi:hypothetical protein
MLPLPYAMDREAPKNAIPFRAAEIALACFAASAATTYLRQRMTSQRIRKEGA